MLIQKNINIIHIKVTYIKFKYKYVDVSYSIKTNYYIKIIILINLS